MCEDRKTSLKSFVNNVFAHVHLCIWYLWSTNCVSDVDSDEE